MNFLFAFYCVHSYSSIAFSGTARTINVSISGLTFANGKINGDPNSGAFGGAIYSADQLSLTSDEFVRNTAPNGFGGAVFSAGTTLSNAIAPKERIGAVIGSFSIPGRGLSNRVRFQLPAGIADNADFTLTANSDLKIKQRVSPTIRSSFTIEVIATDAHAASIVKKFSITVS